MTTANDIILRALQRIGVVAEDAAATDTEANNALIAMNAMMHAWKLEGADVSHADYTLATPVALGPEYHQALAALLAKRLCDEYGLPVPRQIGRDARTGKTLIWNNFRESLVRTTDLPA